MFLRGGLLGALVLGSLGCAAGARAVTAPPPMAYRTPGEVQEESTAANRTLLAQADGAKNAPADGSPARGEAAKTPDEMLVVEGAIKLEVDDVPAAAEALRAEVAALRGRIVLEDLGGAPESWYGSLTLRLPPDQLAALLAFLSTKGTIVERHVQSTDVSKEYFDRDLAQRNLRLTMSRLEELAGRPGIAMAELLQVEQEMTRVRGQIEQLEGEQRFLADRVSLATLGVNLVRRRGAVFAPHVRFHPGVRFTSLTLFSPGDRKATRLGGGAVVHFARAFQIDLDVFPSVAGEDATVVASLGGATYSDLLGGGRHTFLNPYLGLRLGYASLSGQSRFLMAAEVGLELYKQKWLLVDAAARALGLVGDKTDAALQGLFEVQVPF